MTKGNPIVRVVTANTSTDVSYPADVSGLTPSAASTARGMTIHERTGSIALQISFEAGGIAAGNYITLEGGAYLTISEDQQISDIYFRSGSGTPVVEIMISDTMLGAAISVGPNQ